jgi:hypothetical protein
MTTSEILQSEWLTRSNADLFQNSHFNCEIKTMDIITKIVGKREVSIFSEIISPFIKTAIFNQRSCNSLFKLLEMLKFQLIQKIISISNNPTRKIFKKKI